jgi:hypothetical protein
MIRTGVDDIYVLVDGNDGSFSNSSKSLFIFINDPFRK